MGFKYYSEVVVDYPVEIFCRWENSSIRFLHHMLNNSCLSLNAKSSWSLPVVDCSMIEKHKQEQLTDRKRTLITKDFVIDILMVALLAIAIVLLALVL